MLLTANSHSMLKSWGLNPATRSPSEPKMKCNWSKDKRFEEVHVALSKQRRIGGQGLRGDDECRVPCCCVSSGEVFVKGLMRCCKCHHDVDSE